MFIYWRSACTKPFTLGVTSLLYLYFGTGVTVWYYLFFNFNTKNTNKNIKMLLNILNRLHYTCLFYFPDRLLSIISQYTFVLLCYVGSNVTLQLQQQFNFLFCSFVFLNWFSKVYIWYMHMIYYHVRQYRHWNIT